MAEEEAKPLTYIDEVVLKKRRSNEDWAIRRKQQLEERVKKSKTDNFVIKKPEQFIREYRDKVYFSFSSCIIGLESFYVILLMILGDTDL